MSLFMERIGFIDLKKGRNNKPFKEKGFVSIFVIFLVIFSFIYSEDIQYSYIGRNRLKATMSISDSTDTLYLNFPMNDITAVEGIENFHHLKKIEIGKFDMKDLSFIGDFPYLEELYFKNRKPENLDMVDGCESLRILSIENGVSDSFFRRMKAGEEIDLSEFKNLEKFTLTGFEEPLGFVPNIKISGKRTMLSICNMGIESFSDEEIKILKQFIVIDIRNNPVIKNSDELKKLKKNNINFMAY